MTESIARIEELYFAALARPLSERHAFLIECCANNAGLISEIELLLRLSGGTTALDIPVVGFGRDPESDRGRGELLEGARIGEFTIVRLLGEGGMSRVYLAEQSRPQRLVALKVLRLGSISPAARRRFRLESEALARLRHAHIAQIHHAGTHDDGSGVIAYFAMEHVPDALPLTDYAHRHSLSLRERIALLLPVCDAAHHAHLRGIVHRDFKPANVVVDPHGVAKVIDFGIAHATGRDASMLTMATQAGDLLGTFPYMSPEQCDGDPREIDPRADVYSLGVVLYELLCGRPPLDSGTRSLRDRVRVTREVAPLAPSSIDRSLRGDVETILLKSLEKDRERRYASADELAADLRRFLGSEPILARPPTRAYRLSRFVARHRLGFGVAIAIAVLLIATVTATVIALVRSRAAERASSEARTALEQVNYAQSVSLAAADLRLGDFIAARRRLDEIASDRRGWEWRHLRWQGGREESPSNASVLVPGSRLISVEGGASLLVLEEQTSLTKVDATTFAPQLRIDVATATGGRVMDFASCPTRAVVATAGTDGNVWLWDMESGSSIGSFRANQSNASALAFSPDGTELAVGDWARRVAVWDWIGKRVLRTSAAFDDAVYDVTWSDDGSLMAAGTARGTIVLLDPASLQATAKFHDGFSAVTRMQFSPDARRLAAGFDDATLRIYDTRESALPRMCRGHRGAICGLAFLPDGRLASAGEDATVRLWSHDSAAPSLAIGIGLDVALSRDGTRIISAANGVRAWDSAIDEPIVTVGSASASFRDISPDGRRMVSRQNGGHVVVHDLATCEELLFIRGTSDEESRSPVWIDDATLAADAADGGVELRDASSGILLRELAARPAPIVAMAARATMLATLSADGTVAATDLLTGETRTAQTSPTDLGDIAIAPDGSAIACAWEHGGVSLFDRRLEHRAVVRRPDKMGGSIVAFSPDSSSFAISHEAGHVIEIRSATDGAVLRRFPSQRASSLAFHPDDTRIAIGSGAHLVRVIDAQTGKELAAISDDGITSGRLSFTGDGSTLVTTSARGAAQLLESQRPSCGFASRRDALSAAALVERLFQQRRIFEDVERAIMDEPGLPETVRSQALRATRARGEDLARLATDAWLTVRAPGAHPADLRLALRAAQVVMRTSPEHPAIGVTLGAALYRNGKYEEALATLRRLSSASESQPHSAIEAVFMAMTLSKLGRIEEANVAIARAASMVKSDPPRPDSDAASLLQEASALLRSSES